MSTPILRHDKHLDSSLMTMTAAHISTAAHDPMGALKEMGIAKSGDGRAMKLDKKSPEYLLKSGLAGGFAGCVVCACSSSPLPSSAVLM